MTSEDSNACPPHAISRFAGTQGAASRVFACAKLHRKIDRITGEVAEMLERVKGIEPLAGSLRSFSDQQIAFILQQAQKETACEEICRKAGISEAR